MIIQDENRLKVWISHLVKDISDAEPDALAKYVIALVKKPLSDADLEKLCSEKLSVFLQSHTEEFVDRLFLTLKSGNYLTQNFSSAAEQNVKKEEEEAKTKEKSEDVITTETDELVLTDPESEHEPEEPSPIEEKDMSKKVVASSKSKESTQNSKQNKDVKQTTRIEPSRSSKEDSRKLAPEATRKAPPSPAHATTKPPRKRISPPRSTSAERRAEKRPSPMRRRVIIGGGGGIGGGGTRLQGRHYRESRRARSKSRSRSPHTRKEKRPEMDARSLRRHRCRDFHEKGFCMRGDACSYDHGPDPVVVEDSALEKMVRTGGVFDATNAYGVNPPPPGVESTIGSGKALVGGATEGYNPEAPALTTTSVTGIDFSVPPPPIPRIMQRASLPTHQLIYPPGTAPPTLPVYSNSAGLVHIRPATHHIGQSDMGMNFPAVQTTTMYRTNPTILGTGGDAGNGMMMRGGRFKPYPISSRNLASRSLLVKKVPPELNKIAQLDQHFSKFGQVTNIQVQYEGRNDTALVTFKTRRDAMMAYKSTEPIFNNRFIKVFWQNDTQAQQAEAEKVGGPEETTASTTEFGGPTIPLSTGPPIFKGPTYLPRYYAKTFAKPAPPPILLPLDQAQKTGEEETKTTEEEGVTEEKPVVAAEIPATSSAPPIPPNSTALPLPTHQAQPRPIYGRAREAAMKRKSDKETLGKMMELQKMKAGLYAKLVDQQKMLLQKMKSTEDKEQKKKLMELLKKAEEPAKKVKTELEELSGKVREIQQRQAATPKKRRMSLVLGGGHQSGTNENGRQVEGAEKEAVAVSSPKPSTPKKKLFKLCRVVYVSNCPHEHSEKLIMHMEKFGDLFDYDINTEPRMFTYKNPVDAQKAVAEATGSFGLAKLKIEWAPVAKNVKNSTPVVPDRERKPSEQVTPKDLLASLDYDEDEEEEAGRGKDVEGEEEAAEIGADEAD